MFYENKLVRVAWIDATQPIAEWTTLSDLDLLSFNAEILSVGWVLSYTEDRLVLVQSISHKGTDNAGGMGIMSIPASAVRSIKLLRVRKP